MRVILRIQPTIDKETLYRQTLGGYDCKRLTENVRRLLDRIVSEKRFDLAESDTLCAEISAGQSPDHSKYLFDLLGEHFAVDVLADMLVTVLRSLQELDQGFLSRLSQEGGRTRPIVTQNRSDLYPGRPDLSHHSREITDSWFVGTNYSKRDVTRILQLVCKVGGLVFGEDLSGPAIWEMQAHMEGPKD